jgi:trimeric autotransporter adhesin
MKTIGSFIIVLMTLVCYDGISQAKQEQKKKNAGRSTSSQENQNKNQQQPGGAESSSEGNLIGDQNESEGAGNTDAQSTSDYRNNEVSGNPNNISTDEGSHRRTSTGRETDESSGSINLDSAAAGQEGTTTSGQSTSADPDASNVPAVIQESSSQSGSPAVLSGEEGSDRDGTNNVQRAKPNMAGSDVKGLKYGKGKDSDREIREGTRRQAKEGVGNNVSRQRTKGQQGARQRANRSDNPHPRDMGTLPDQKLNEQGNQDEDDLPDAQSENNNITGQENSDQMLNRNSDEKKEGSKRKKRRWFGRN